MTKSAIIQNTEIEIKRRRNFWYNPKLKQRARELRNHPTVAENKLWFEYLRQIPHKALRQKPIGNYIVDFYLPQIKIVIEVDGETHLRDIGYDDKRTKELERLGLKVIRFWNDDVINGFVEVCKIIEGYLDKNDYKSP
ncbi:MAG: DUF559 domain-containing protein [Patescibacteria group bacterium]|nr:DUF559 domain-containing protein [Patescibacteria group bacterium]